MFTPAENAILELLTKERRWWYGLELVEASEGRLKRGTVYVHLSNLEEQGLVDSREENDDEFQPRYSGQMRRRLYRITESGTREWQNQKADNLSLAPEPA